MSFVDWLSSEMRERDWSQADLSRATKLSRQAVSHLLSGRSKSPDYDTLKKIASGLDLPLAVVNAAAGIGDKPSRLDSLDEEALHIVKQLDRDKKQQAVRVLRALSDEGEKRRGLSTKHVTE